MKFYNDENNMITNVTTALMMLRDLGCANDIPINIQFDGLYITVIVNFGKRDSRIHSFYLQDMYRYREKFDDIYYCINKDIAEIMANRQRAAAGEKED